MKDWSITRFDDVHKGDIIEFTPPPANTAEAGKVARRPITGTVLRTIVLDGKSAHWAAQVGTIHLETEGGVATGQPSDRIEVYR